MYDTADIKFEYDIIGADCPLELVNRVNGACREGWRPLGQLVVDRASHYAVRYYQAMMRETYIVPKYMQQAEPMHEKLGIGVQEAAAAAEMEPLK